MGRARSWARAQGFATAAAFALLVAAVTVSSSAARAADAPSPGAAAAGRSAITIRTTGPAETVFRYAVDRCDEDDIPDAPARAFRDASGSVTLFATHWRNRRLRGQGLLDVRPDCAVVLEGTTDPRPERFDDRLWIASTWTADGTEIAALVHSEYQGHRHPGGCAAGARPVECWYNVVSQAVSRDGGRSFGFERRPPPLVAAVPFPHRADAGRAVGFFNPTNILRHDGAWHVMVFTQGGGVQPRGNCLLRTDRISDPSAWRAWGGGAFDVRFADPHADALRPEAHLCAPVGLGALNWAVTSVSRHRRSGLFVALMIGGRPRPASSGLPDAVVLLASTSRDLLRWSPPTVLREIAAPHRFACEGEAPVGYPSLLDPESPDRNFETVGNTAMLFMTRFNLRNCRTGMDRDLVRVPVELTAAGD